MISKTSTAGFLFVLLLAGPALAQNLNFASTDSDAPIEIFADDGIEWQQEKLIFLARGNARAVRGDVTVHAQLLRAYYREGKGGSTEISRLDAETKVKIVTPTETAYGEAAVYDVDKGVLVLSGGRVRLVSGQDRIEADRQLEYWERKQMAVARGNAVAVRIENGQKKRIKGDVLVAYFRKNKKGGIIRDKTAMEGEAVAYCRHSEFPDPEKNIIPGSLVIDAFTLFPESQV